MSGASAQPRRRDLDLLRAVVVAGLVPFHSARIFSFDLFYVSNPQKSLLLSVWVAFGVLWGMPLLFLVSGQTAARSMALRSTRAFIRERTLRLLVPFISGMLLLAPPHQYLWLRADPAYREPYLRFVRRFFQVVPSLDLPWLVAADPRVMLFDAAHLYFLYFLFAFSLLALLLSRRLKGVLGPCRLSWLGNRLVSPAGILLLGLPVGAVEAALRSENYGGWNRYAFLLFFLYGFLLQSVDRRAGLRKQAPVALTLALLATAVGFWLYLRAALAGEDLGTGYGLLNVVWRMLKGLGGWWWAVAILGWSERLLSARGDGDAVESRGLERLRAYANEATLPVYMLHHLVVVVIGFYVVRLPLGLWVKYAAITLASLAVTLGIYQGLIRRVVVLRFLFGMRTGPIRTGHRPEGPGLLP
jgi:glucan biosynthesis protein C